MGHALPQSIQMTNMECGNCGIAYAVPETWRMEKKRNRSTWYCPNGHPRVYNKSEADRLRAKLDEQIRETTRQAERAAAAERAEQAAVTREQKVVKELRRVRKRVEAGVCLCCNRTFQNLARHMATKHAEARLLQGGKAA